MKKILWSFLGAFLFLGMPLWAGAQEEGLPTQEDAESGWSIPAPIENGVDCFDYYKFQSVSVVADPEKVEYQPGEDAKFFGKINNENDYPVVDGNLYVRIAKYREDFDTQGYDVVDEFFAMEGVALLAKSSKDFEFTWNISPELSGGKYNVTYFFTVGKKFNLGGLPFSNEIVAGMSEFSVKSEISKSLSFDRRNVKFNDQPYLHIGDWPSVEKGSNVGFKYNLSNTFDKDLDVLVSFTAYYWDSLSEEDHVKSYAEEVSVPKNSSKEFVFNLENVDRSVYYVQAKAESGTLKSMVNTRFVVENREGPRLNYPAITGFPIKEGDKVNLFTCFHNTTYANTEGTVELELFDEKNNLVGSVKHEGLIPSAMSAIKSEISAKKDYDYLVLKARVLDKAGNEVDKYETVYSCEQFGNCKENSQSASGVIKRISESSVMAIIFAVLFVIVFIAVIIKLKGNKNSVRIFIAFSVLGGSLLFANNQAMAAAVSYSHGQYRPGSGGLSGIFNVTVASGTVTMNNTLSGSATVACGGKVTYTYSPTLTFGATGVYWDTPNGKICTGSYAYNDVRCFGSNIMTPNYGSSQTIVDSAGRSGRIYWTSQKPTVSLSSSNNSIVSCSGLVCTGHKAGTVSITANYGSVNSKVWSAINMQCDRDSGNITRLNSNLTQGFWGTPTWANTGKDNYSYWQSPSDKNVSTADGTAFPDYASKIKVDKNAWTAGNSLQIPAESNSRNLTVGTCAVIPSGTLAFSPTNLYVGQTGTRTITLTNDADGVAQCTCTGPDAGSFSWSTGSVADQTFTSTGTRTCTCTAKSSTGDERTFTGSINSVMCTGTRPANTLICPGDTTSLTSSLAWAKVGTCTNTRKCEYYEVIPSGSLTYSPNPVTIGAPYSRTVSLINDADNVAQCSCTGLNAGSFNWTPGTTSGLTFDQPGTQTCTCNVASVTGQTASFSETIEAKALDPVVDYFDFESKPIGPMNSGIDFITQNAVLKWNIQDAGSTYCGTGCTCTITDPSGSTSDIDYNTSKSKTFTLGVANKDSSFKIRCRSSFGNQSNEMTAQAPMSCNPAEDWRACTKLCGDETQNKESIDASCNKNNTDSRDCAIPECPLVGQPIEVR
ncbi:MAG: hypothetical protein GX765_01645 [Candidatus Moranbacteria bacterium]|nr:hypothetical protein [Candidatus Moranbacteria bacterium]